MQQRLRKKKASADTPDTPDALRLQQASPPAAPYQ
jgi:hypothetical protein